MVSSHYDCTFGTSHFQFQYYYYYNCCVCSQVSSPSKPRSYSDAPVPSSPSIQPFQKRFSPPPCPRSQTSPRPPSPRSPRVPSPLISDRRASVTSDVVSVSSSEGSPESVHRQRIPSVKEKVSGEWVCVCVCVCVCEFVSFCV